MGAKEDTILDESDFSISFDCNKDIHVIIDSCSLRPESLLFLVFSQYFVVKNSDIPIPLNIYYHIHYVS